MKKILVCIIIIGLILMGSLSFAEDSKEILILKRELAQEKIMRIQAQLQLLQQQFKDGQDFLKEVTKEFNDLNAKLNAMESKKEEIPKPGEKKK